MLSTVTAIVALCVAVVSLIAVLGVMREVMILRSVVHHADPANPTYIGAEVPPSVVELLTAHEPRLAEDSFILLYLSGGCSTCMTLLDELEKHLRGGERRPIMTEHVTAVVINDETCSAARRLRALGINTMKPDDSARLVELSEIFATPSATVITNPGFVAADHTSGVGLEWMIDRTKTLQRSDAQPLRLRARAAQQSGHGGTS